MRRVLYLVLCLSGCLLIVLLVRARRATREQMTVPRGPGGQERTLEEFESLLEAAGYELAGTTPTEGGMFVIEGRPAG